jgi:hypothetical protein
LPAQHRKLTRIGGLPQFGPTGSRDFRGADRTVQAAAADFILPDRFPTRPRAAGREDQLVSRLSVEMGKEIAEHKSNLKTHYCHAEPSKNLSFGPHRAYAINSFALEVLKSP